MDQVEKPTEDFRKQPPAPLSPRPLNIPTADEASLPNGLRVVIVETNRLPVVSYRLVFRTGDAYEPPDLPGLVDIMTAMLNEGTESRTSRQIADEVARLGATLTAGASSDYTAVAASALSIYSDQILELLSDVALRSSFPEGELELIRQNSLQNLIAQRAQPSFLANERLARVIFGQHPYAVISPTPESIEAMTRERLISFHRATFIPNNAVLIIVGDVKRDAIMKRINDLFGTWKEGPIPEAQFPAPPERTAREVYLVDRPGSAQSNIVVANLCITRTSPDYFPMLVMHTVLGANASSRLFMNLREEKGYTYGAYTNLDARRDAGTFRATAEVRTPVTGASLEEFFYEFDRIRNEPVSEKELSDAKSYLTGIFPIRLETQEGLVDQLVQIKMFDLPDDYLQTYADQVNAVTREDVQHVARQYITPDKAAIVIVGDATEVINQVTPYAQSVEIYDSAGNRKEAQDAESPTAADGATNLSGTWMLEIATPFGQPSPATLVLEQDGDAIRGTLQSDMGDAPLNNIKVKRNTFDAKLALELQGQRFEAHVTGRIDNDRLSGTITINLPVAPPISFTGTRANQ